MQTNYAVDSFLTEPTARDLFAGDGFSLTDDDRREVPVPTIHRTVTSTLAVAALAGWTTLAIPVTPTAQVFGPSSTAGNIIGYYVRVSEKDSLIKHLNSYHTLGEDWDGYGGVPPSEQTIADGITFVDYMSENFVTPRIGVSGDGEISFFWESDGYYIDVGLIGDGTFSFYARGPEGDELFGDDIPITAFNESDLVSVIPKIA